MTLRIAILNVLRTPLRTSLAAAVVAVAIGTAALLAALTSGFQTSISELYEARKVDLVVSKLSGRNPLPVSFPIEIALRVARVEGVASADPASFEWVNIHGSGKALLYGWAPGGQLWEHVEFDAGRPPRRDSEVALGIGTAARLKLRPGDPISINARSFTVSGIYRSASLLENSSLAGTLPTLDLVTGKPGFVKHLNLHLHPDASPHAVASEIERRFRGFAALLPSRVVGDNLAIEVAEAMVALTVPIACALAALAISNAMMLSVIERRSELAALMAQGWRKRRIALSLLLEAELLAVPGAVAGFACALILGWGVGHFSPAGLCLYADFSVIPLSFLIALPVISAALGTVVPCVAALRTEPTRLFAAA